VAAGPDVGYERGELAGGDRPAVHHDPLAVADEVRLGGLADAPPGRPERASRQREHAALAVGPRDERAAHRELRVADLAQARTGPSQAEADAESPAIRDRTKRVGVGEATVRRHAGPPADVTRGSARPRRRRTG